MLLTNLQHSGVFKVGLKTINDVNGRNDVNACYIFNSLTTRLETLITDQDEGKVEEEAHEEVEAQKEEDEGKIKVDAPLHISSIN